VEREAPCTFEPLAQLLVAEQLQDQEGHLRVLVDAGIEDLDDELAVDVPGDPDLALEARTCAQRGYAMGAPRWGGGAWA
jgi:hypothetical protein